MSDSTAIDNALIALLASDVTLLTLCPNGVYWEEAPAVVRATRFVIVSLVDAHDTPQFGARSFEDALYLVKAVALSSSGADVRAAAARIDALLEGGTLAIAGYSVMVLEREERVRYTEVDDADQSIRWQHRGGRYRVMVSPN